MKNTYTKPWENGPLSVTENGRYFQNGTVPFFWQGDTAWLLFKKLTFAQSCDYLKNRADKGFNVIQAVLVHSFPNCETSLPMGGIDRPNLIDNDFARPLLEKGGYWDQVDDVIEEAEKLGLYMGLLPVWGSMVKNGYLNLDNVDAYAEFIAKRFGKHPNILWIIGGDCRGSDGTEVWNRLGTKIKEFSPLPHIMGYHPFGRTSSSLWFHQEKWLDFNMFQSGHRRYDQASLNSWDDNAGKETFFGEDNWRYVERDRQAQPAKPTLDGEPSYEQIPQGLHDPSQPFWQDCDVRRYAYWSVFAGSAGHTYGSNAVMQFYHPDTGKGSYGVKECWQDALHHPGSGQMQHLHKLITSFDFVTAKPMQELLACEEGEKYDRISVLAGKNFALFYDYSGRKFSVRLDKVPVAGMIHASWFDPVSGIYSYIGEVSGKEAEFIPPHRPWGQNDWVLVLD